MSSMDNDRKHGIVKWYNEEKGYGFIVPGEGDRDVFVHRSQIQEPSRLLLEGDKVGYTPRQGKKGIEAIEVKRVV